MEILPATARSLVPLTVMVTVAGTLVLLDEPLSSVAMYWKETSRDSPLARSWKSEPGSKVKVPSLLLTTEPSVGWLVMMKVWVSEISASVCENEAVTVLPSSVELMEILPATGWLFPFEMSDRISPNVFTTLFSKWKTSTSFQTMSISAWLDALLEARIVRFLFRKVKSL